MDEQMCYVCWGEGENIKRGPCRTCDGTGVITRTGPYRLDNGDWSDGVDRSKRIDNRPCSNRHEVTTGKKHSHVWHESEQVAEFDTWAKAIAYADRMARTNQGENK